MTTGAGLELENIVVTFGPTTALRGVTLSLTAGETCGLIGPNGAGKTTLFDSVTGFVRPTSGSVTLNGRDITRLGAARRARLGLRRTFQGAELFSDLSVRDNLLVAQPRQSTRSVDDLLERCGLTSWAEHNAGELPAGLQRIVGIVRAIAGEPTVLLLDEPGAGLQGDEVDALSQFLRETVAAEGLTALLVDHDMELIHKTCATVHVLDFGELIATGTPEQIRANEKVQNAYLGT